MQSLSKDQCLDLLAGKYVGRLGYIFQETPEIVPITYFLDREQDAIISYSAEGHKINCMRKKPYVSFQVDEIRSLTNWKSVMVHAIFQETKRSDAKNLLHLFTQGVKNIIHNEEHRDPVYLKEFSSKIEESKESIIYRLKILNVKGMGRKDDILST